MATVATREPTLIRGAITAAATAIVHLLVVFGVPLPDGLAESIAPIVDAVGTIVGLFWIRAGVTPAADPVVPAPAVDPLAPADPH